MKKHLLAGRLMSFGRIAFLALIALSFGIMDAQATHFRYGNITWRKINNSTNQVEFTITTAWRGNFFTSTIPNLNQTVNLNHVFRFGDGATANMVGIVTARNVTENWFICETKLVRTYATSGNFLAFFNSCCRVSNLGGGANDQNYRCESVVNIGNTNNSPTSTMPPIVNLQRGFAAATFNITGADPDNDTLSYRLATLAECGINPPTISGVQRVTVNSNGTASFNTLGLNVGQQFAVVVRVSDGQATTFIDFIVNIVAQSTPPVFDYSVTPTNGQIIQVAPGTPIKFPVKALDTDNGSSVTLSAVGVPSGASWSPGAAANPRTDTFSWTPGNGNLGTRVITFTAQDNIGVQTQTAVIITVSLKPVFNFPPTPNSVIVAQPGDSISFTVESTDPDVNDSVVINKIEGIDNSESRIAINNSLYNGVDFTVPTPKANTTSGHFGWRPNNPSWGLRNVIFTAQDKYNDKAEHTVEIIVNTTPSFVSTPPHGTVIAGNTYTYNIVAKDTDLVYGDWLEIHGSMIPSWLTLTDNGNGTATLTGTPAIADSGEYHFDLEAEDSFHHSNIGGIPHQHIHIKVIPCQVVAKAQDITVYLNASGQVSIEADDVDNGSTANCGIASMVLSQTDFDCSHVGTNQVTLTITDDYNNSASATANVDVVDQTAPEAKCKNITVQLDSDGNASLVASQIDDQSSDACGILSLSIDKSSFNCTNVGSNDVVLTVTDNNNNVSTCTAKVEVEDNVSPTALCKNATVSLSGGNASISTSDIDNTSSDACGILSLSLDKSSFSCSDIGTQTVTLTVTDNNQNTSTCTADVTVNGVLPTCTLSVTPSDNTFTGGVATNIYLGYGPQSATISASATGGSGFSYTWTGNGISGSGSSVTFAPASEGTYVITCEVENSNGCKTTCSVTFCVLDIRSGGSGKNQKVYLCHVPGGNSNNPQNLSISVNAVPSHLGKHSGDALGKCNQSCASQKRMFEEMPVYEEGDFFVQVYPNPSTSEFNFELESASDEPVTIVITDLSGREIWRQSDIHAHEVVQFGADLSTGIYLLQVHQGDQFETIKINKFK